MIPSKPQQNSYYVADETASVSRFYTSNERHHTDSPELWGMLFSKIKEEKTDSLKEEMQALAISSVLNVQVNRLLNKSQPLNMIPAVF